jgi:hypothetical protein
MNMNDCRCVRGHAADLIEKFCVGGASSRHVARQQVVHNEKVSVARKAHRCRQSCQLTHAGRLTSSVESYLGHLVHRIIQPECAPRPTLTQGRAEPDRLFFSKYLYYRVLGDTHSCQGQKTRSQTSKGLAVSALRARPSSFQKTRSRYSASVSTRVKYVLYM